jgi:hypothetical protein
MKVWFRLRRWLAWLVLRGRVLDWWMRWKVSGLERRYLHELVHSSGRPAVAETVPRLSQGDPLRQILFISDIHWELDELVPELERICRVETLDLGPALRSRQRSAPASEAAQAAVTNYMASRQSIEPDVILLYGRAAILSLGLFDELRRRLSCPIVGLNLDDKIEFLDYRLYSEANDNYQHWARYFDLNLTNVRAVVDWYVDRGLPVRYLPEGYHPRAGLGPPVEPVRPRYEISFVGSRRLEREVMIRRLWVLGVPVEPIGPGWPHARDERPELIYRDTLINLGIGFASPSRVLTTLKARDFECPGAGGCYLTTYNWELGLHYEIGREILCYRSVEELVEIYSFYRRRPNACLAIARAAYQRCLNEHTWEKRFREVFKEMGFARM